MFVAALAALPSLPDPEPLRLLAMSGSLSLVAFSATLILVAKHGPQSEIKWTVVPLILGAVTLAFGGQAPHIHQWIAFTTIGVAMRNTITLHGWARMIQALGALCWFVSIVCARLLFGVETQI
jgi:hypothetical protein